MPQRPRLFSAKSHCRASGSSGPVEKSRLLGGGKVSTSFWACPSPRAQPPSRVAASPDSRGRSRPQAYREQLQRYEAQSGEDQHDTGRKLHRERLIKEESGGERRNGQSQGDEEVSLGQRREGQDPHP